MRQIIDDEFAKDGLRAADIRSREIGRNSKYYKELGTYNIYSYWANDGMEYFICYESLDEVALFGFIRLRLIDFKDPDVVRDVELTRIGARLAPREEELTVRRDRRPRRQWM